MNDFERTTIKWARLAVLLSGVAALFVCLQWYEMHTSGTDTHTLALAANASISASHTDQRAWVGSGDGKFAIDTKTLKAEVTVKNVGKTPATDVSSNIAWIGKDRGQELQLSDIRYPSSDLANGTLFPGQTTQVQNSLPDPIPAYHATFVERLRKGDSVLYVFGNISYRDIFGTPHWTHFCMVVHRDLTSNNACNIYADSDPDQTVK